jgi:hypothetical protein
MCFRRDLCHGNVRCVKRRICHARRSVGPARRKTNGQRTDQDTRRYKAGYEIRYYRISGDEAGGGLGFVMRSAFTPEGYYIGDPKRAHRLIVRDGIRPELMPGNEHMGNVCCIGFCKREQKWYEWSHRARWGFGIGDEVTSEDHLCAHSGWTDEYLSEHPEENRSLPVGFKAKDLADCKRMAIAYAEAVG